MLLVAAGQEQKKKPNLFLPLIPGSHLFNQVKKKKQVIRKLTPASHAVLATTGTNPGVQTATYPFQSPQVHLNVPLKKLTVNLSPLQRLLP